MRPQESRRQPEEQFYFENGELVIDREVLPEHTPTVQSLNSRSIVGAYRGVDGEPLGVEHTGLNWRFYPQAGVQLLTIETATGEVAYRTVSPDDEYQQASCAGEVVNTYEVQPGDLLITGRSVNSREEIIIIPADAPLPDSEAHPSYQPLGVITTQGELITWGNEGVKARRLTELTVADRLAASPLDKRTVREELGEGYSLRGSLATSDIATTYLKWFAEKFGKDYLSLVPAATEKQWDAFNGELTQAQFGHEA